MTDLEPFRWLPLPSLLEPFRPRTKGAKKQNRTPVPDGFLAGPENLYIHLLFDWLTQGIIVNPLESSPPRYVPLTNLPQLLPLSIYGPSGSGKTHLARGFAGYLKKNKIFSSVFCENASDFYRNLTEAIANGTKEEFRNKILQDAVIILDNIDYLAEKKSGQDELLWLLEECRNTGKIILLTMTSRPSNIEGLNRQIVSRLDAGSLFRLNHPGPQSRRILVQNFASFFDVPVTEEVISCIVEKFPDSVPVLYGNFMQLILKTQNEKGFLTTERVQNFLQEQLPVEIPSLDEIVRAVASFYRLPINEIRGKKRNKTIALARNVSVWLARKFTDTSLGQLGEWFSGRDHTTILHSCNEIERRLPNDPHLSSDVDEITSSLAINQAKAHSK